MKPGIVASSSFAAIEQHRKNKWIKWFLRVYWLVIAAHLLAQLGSFLFLPYPMGARQFYMDVLFYPTLFMSAVAALAQYIHRVADKYSFYALFIAGTLIALVIIHLNMDIRIIAAVMLLPIFASAIFFRVRLTLLTAGLQVLGFCLLYEQDHWFRTYMSAFDLIAVILFLVIGTGVAIIIIISGRELVQNLEAAMTAEQQLIIENAVMSHQSKTDALTGLYNHRSFHEFYEKAMEFAADGQPFHLALIDIDNFKAINDTYGHRVGDLILSSVSRIIKDNIAPSDIASRYGGEEFAVLLFEQSFEDAYALVENIRRQLAETPQPDMDGKAVTVSAGLQSYAVADVKEKLFEDADAFLYMAKRGGKNKTVTSRSA